MILCQYLSGLVSCSNNTSSIFLSKNMLKQRKRSSGFLQKLNVGYGTRASEAAPTEKQYMAPAVLHFSPSGK